MAHVIVLGFAGISKIIFDIVPVDYTKLWEVLILIDFSTIRGIISVREVLLVWV